MDLNVVVLSGRLGRDPEMKYLQDGTPVVNFSFAVSLYGDKTLWIDVEGWRKTAESINERLTKGSKVMIRGELGMDRWETNDGQKRSKIKMTAMQWFYAESKRPDSQPQQQQQAPPPPQGAQPSSSDSSGGGGGTDYPF